MSTVAELHINERQFFERISTQKQKDGKTSAHEPFKKRKRSIIAVLAFHNFIAGIHSH